MAAEVPAAPAIRSGNSESYANMPAAAVAAALAALASSSELWSESATRKRARAAGVA